MTNKTNIIDTNVLFLTKFNELFAKDEEDVDLAVIYLQKIIRGKAIQNMVKTKINFIL
jgi:hypothetical protein